MKSETHPSSSVPGLSRPLRELYIEFFQKHRHKKISGQSLLPDNDPTVLFTTAGMHPLVPYLLGEPHPRGRRLVNWQKCIRTGDIESVGDHGHLTFFEMLGNWSLGDYFKEESLRMSYEFLTSPEYLNLPPERLFMTVFEGDEQVEADRESAQIWESLGMPADHISYLPRKDNWWGPAGETGPCGPDSEIFMDTLEPACGPDCRPGCPCGKYLEIWNNVFMQYNKTASGEYRPLERKCVDTGMGLERTTAILEGKSSVYETGFFRPILRKLEEILEVPYEPETKKGSFFRIIADHAKAAVMILGDPRGVLPSNLGQGYILRRLIRRAFGHGRPFQKHDPFLFRLVPVITEIYRDVYPELKDREETIIKDIKEEEILFQETLMKGEQEFNKLLPRLEKNPSKVIPGRLAFRLYDTFGFPLAVTQGLAREKGFTVDVPGFEKAFEKHKESSKKGITKTFKGGLGDQSETATRYHTATHLLHEALRRVLGEHIRQKGSNITAERLRFDFSHTAPLTAEELKQTEDLVNENIRENLPVSKEIMSLEQAKEKGARALFEARYGEEVSVYAIGDFSLEVCGGPHVQETGVLGRFKIVKEQSSSRGVRRIRAVLEEVS